MLNYKLRVLLYDFRNLQKDPLFGLRSLKATDVLYLGLSYFTTEESALIKVAKTEPLLPRLTMKEPRGQSSLHL